MSAVVKEKLLLYADDSAFLASFKDKQDIETMLSSELNIVRQWLVSKKLSSHLGKTEFILFGSQRRLKSQSSLNINCNSQSIDSNSSVKYFTRHTKILFVNSLDQCHFDHALSAWYYSLYLKHKIQVTPKKIIRFVLDLHPRFPIGRYTSTV